MNSVFAGLIEQARTGDVTAAAQQYAQLMGLPEQECLQTFRNIRKVLLGKIRVRNANEKPPEIEDLEVEGL